MSDKPAVGRARHPTECCCHTCAHVVELGAQPVGGRRRLERRLITGDPQAPVLSVARPGRVITATPFMDREDVARLISKYDLLAVPVVDHGRVIGIVTVDDVIDAIVQESAEDVQKFGGMAAINEPYMEIGF